MTTTAFLLLVLAAAPAPAAAAAPAPAPAPMTERQKTLYAVGVSAADSFKVFDLKPGEVAVLQRGLSDALLGKKVQVDMTVYRPKVNELAAASYAATSKATVARYAAQKGAVTTASGLVFISVQAGSGAKPGPEDIVKVHYDGKLPDGTVFDSSRRRGEPSTLPLDRVIKCWKEGLQRMQVGEKAVLVCPPEIAYGEAGKPPTIPPASALIFDVELVAIEAPR
jgi:FKBP-type peptidyl-prolyl cis-trans isomerase FkpA